MPSLHAYQATSDIDALRVHSNDWILFRPESAPADHTIILCRFRGEVIIGIYRVTEAGPALHLFSASEPVTITRNDEFRVWGAVVGTRPGPGFPELRSANAT